MNTGSGDLRQTAIVELNTCVYTAGREREVGREGGREGGKERHFSPCIQCIIHSVFHLQYRVTLDQY